MTKRVALLVLLATAALAGCASAPVASHPHAAPLAPHRPAVAPHRPAVAPHSPAVATPHARATAPIPKAKPSPNACAGNTAAQLALVSVAKQHIWMCSRAHLVYDAAVTTGAVELPYDSTPTGTYEIQAKQTDQTLTLLSGAQYQVRYWIPFDGPLFGFHDSSWQSFPYGSPRYRTEGSHGCVHMPLAAITFLYRWADVGAAVTIRA